MNGGMVPVAINYLIVTSRFESLRRSQETEKATWLEVAFPLKDQDGVGYPVYRNTDMLSR